MVAVTWALSNWLSQLCIAMPLTLAVGLVSGEHVTIVIITSICMCMFEGIHAGGVYVATVIITSIRMHMHG